MRETPVSRVTRRDLLKGAGAASTGALLAGSALLLAAIASGASLPLSLVAGGVGGAVAVGLLWAVDPDRWRP